MSKMVIFDTETTGSEDEDKIIQIAAMILDGRGEVEIVEDLCNTTIPIKYEAMAVHHITPEMIKDKELLEETKTWKRLTELDTEDNYFIAHNAPFDVAMVKKEGMEIKSKVIDTLKVSKHLFDEHKRHSLQYFRYALGLYKLEKEESDRYGLQIKPHDAISDVLVLKLLLRKLAQRAKELFPDENYLDVFYRLTTEPLIIKEFTFGKYKDKSVKDVVEQDPGYVNWMLEKMENLDEDLRYTLKKHLDEI